VCGQVGSLLEQRRPDPHAISVAERAQARLARRRFPVLHTRMRGHCRVKVGRLSPLALRVRGEPLAALASLGVLASSCDVAVRERRLGFLDSVNAVGTGSSWPPICPERCSLRMTAALASDPAAPVRARAGSCDAGVAEECYLVDPASSHMLVSKIKPCMCKYEQIQTVKLRMAH
jgi:hypothetical protein